MSERAPAVAGYFYSSEPDQLRREIARFCETDPSQRRYRPKGILVPHAGFVYSGAVAGRIYGRLEPPSLAILLGPNHTGLGPRASLWSSGHWRTPLGAVAVDETAARALLENSRILEADELAHLKEHCLEVQLPFLQRLNPKIRIVPIVLGHLSPGECATLGEELADFIQTQAAPTLLVVSSDMSHYLPDEETRRLDRLAIDKLEALDPEGLYETVRRNHITMCGYIPAAVALTAVKRLGAEHAELAAYATSGEVSGDYEQVVGYAGVVIE